MESEEFSERMTAWKGGVNQFYEGMLACMSPEERKRLIELRNEQSRLETEIAIQTSKPQYDLRSRPYQKAKKELGRAFDTYVLVIKEFISRY
ncbi:MAG: hypothetical protein AABX11_05255 [Nanoarchaeota archaeon]